MEVDATVVFAVLPLALLGAAVGFSNHMRGQLEEMDNKDKQKQDDQDPDDQDISNNLDI
jgi:hypothetical protein